VTEDEYILEVVSNQKRIYGFIKSVHPFPNEIDDILQETNITLIKKYNDFDGSKEFIPWAMAISRWTWMAYKQKRWRHTSKVSYREDNIWDVADPQSCAHYKNEEENEFRTYLLNKASEQLSKDEKIMLKMAVDGETLEEMSLKLGVNKRCLSTRKSRLLSKLKFIVKNENSKVPI
jgi:RNA polymerase sigma-70 factor (ECF subfamily)